MLPNAMQIQYSVMQCHAMQCNAHELQMQYNAMQMRFGTEKTRLISTGFFFRAPVGCSDLSPFRALIIRDIEYV